jgi:signal transduction histidine kinase/DNA-binding response OmpR family regulator
MTSSPQPAPGTGGSVSLLVAHRAKPLLQRAALFGVLAAVVLLLLMVALSWTLARNTQQAASFVSHTHEVLAAVNQARANLYRFSANQRAYALSPLPEFVQERDAAFEQLQADLGRLHAFTADNPVQQERLQRLQRVLGDVPPVLPGEPGSLPLEVRQRRLLTLTGLLASMEAEEQRLLGIREDIEAERNRTSTMAFSALLLLLALMTPLLLLRIRADLRARRSAEAAVEAERHYDALHVQALTLYNAEPNRRATLNNTLRLLTQDGLFPVAVFYAHEELGGRLHLSAGMGAGPGVMPAMHIGEGLLGRAAAEQVPLHLEGFDPATGLLIETGLATLRPAALLINPVLHRGRVLGVVALASRARLDNRACEFVQRLCAQLGVALHNIDQMEGLNLLAEQLRERGEDIQRKNELLDHASRMKSEFLANMSHELRTPLNAVIGFSEVLRDGLAGDLSEEQREFVGEIHSSGKHLLSLINDILDLSKIEAGEMTLELGSVEPALLAESGLAVVRERAASRRIRLSSALPMLGALELDARKTKQILFNLLSNAVKFTPDGGEVSLALERVDAAVIEALRPSEGSRLFAPAQPLVAAYLQITVNDSGIGITPQGLQELFQPFVQIDSALSRQYEGTGLGLTLVQRLAELQGGGLRVQSTPGKGSCFTVWLPWRVPAEAEALVLQPAAPAAPSPELPSRAEPLVLVVEDDPGTAAMLRMNLMSQGLRVELAIDGEDGLQAAKRLQPDAIVLDVLLPRMDGWDLMTRLKDDPATRHVPVVIVSVTDEPSRGFALGAAQVLLKPVSREDLLAAVDSLGLNPQAGAGHVLVVDDDPRAVQVVSRQLEAAGFKTLGAYGGQEALDLVGRHRVDLIVLDLMMPQVSGFDVVEALASRPETAGIAIIILTAHIVGEQDRQMLRGRVQRIMEKSSFEPASLVAEVRRALAGRRPQSGLKGTA